MSRYKGAWPLSKQRAHWLYDEVDVDSESQGALLHRVLFSDGIILEIPFKSVWIHTVPMRASDDAVWSKQIA
ncbi:hypothetical protein [Paludisphaera borealis]|uniref:Uncharacterized protein n=1 Tax=Paludisphaera borealis TaxID=1387353 RepID=A0A1U7CQG7_9BACT|nr:hypothetical protein [Paludisphaera borealis]APW61177.1 hypothetical protein BSF38_02681 [Paludisphaera borealis]